MIRRIIKVDEDKCAGCGTCLTVCNKGALTIVNGKARLVKENICDSNGICVGVCPNYAISYEERDVDAFDDSSAANEKLKRMLAGTPSPFPPYVFSGNSGHCPCINLTRIKNGDADVDLDEKDRIKDTFCAES